MNKDYPTPSRPATSFIPQAQAQAIPGCRHVRDIIPGALALIPQTKPQTKESKTHMPTGTNTNDLTTILVNDPPSEAELKAVELLRLAQAMANGGPSGTRYNQQADYRIGKALEALHNS